MCLLDAISIVNVTELNAARIEMRRNMFRSSATFYGRFYNGARFSDLQTRRSHKHFVRMNERVLDL